MEIQPGLIFLLSDISCLLLTLELAWLLRLSSRVQNAKRANTGEGQDLTFLEAIWWLIKRFHCNFFSPPDVSKAI